MLATTAPIANYPDLDGTPLQGGKIYFGQPGQNPETSPITVYWDAALTQPVAQPVSTVNGFISRSGTPAQIFSESDYSITIRNGRGQLVYYAPTSAYFDPSTQFRDLADSDPLKGVALVAGAARVVSSIAALRALPRTGSKNVFVTGYYAPGDGGGGAYYFDAADTTSADNGGTIIVATDGGRWKLSFTKFLSVKQFGAKLDGTTDDTAFIQAALTAGAGRTVYSPGSSNPAKITSQLSVTAATRIVGDGITRSIWKKYFNGDLFSVTGSYVRMEGIRLDGNGASSYTGGCINLGTSSFNFLAVGCSFINSIDTPIIFSARCSEQHFVSCEMYAYSSHAVYCARVTAADGSANPANRHFTNCYTGGGLFVDFSGMVTTFVTGCYGATWKTDANTSKLIMGQSRFTVHQELGDPDLVVYGTDHQIVGNSVDSTNANGIRLDASCSNVVWRSNTVIQNNSITQITDNTTIGSVNTNNVDTLLESYTPTWSGTTGALTLGNGAITGKFWRNNRTCQGNISITKGTSTVVPTGIWSFQIPFKSRVDAGGIALITLNSGVSYVARFQIYGGSSVGYLYLNGVSGAMTDASLSMSGTVTFSIDFAFDIAYS